jgi:hypothetical protein
VGEKIILAFFKAVIWEAAYVRVSATGGTVLLKMSAFTYRLFFLPSH